MLQYEQIIPECYADTNFISTLLEADVNHSLSCTAVAGLMNDTFNNRFGVGIIDHDKQKPGYLSDFNEIAKRVLPPQKSNEKDVCVRLYQHKTRPHYIITIEPAIERLILRCAAMSNIKMEDYHLANTLEGLKERTKHKSSNKDFLLRTLFQTLLNAGNTDILALQETLRYFVSRQRDVDIEELRSIFLR